MTKSRRTRLLCGTALAPGAELGLEVVDQVDDVVEAAACALSNAGPCDGDGEMGLAGAGSADEHDVALAPRGSRRWRSCRLSGVGTVAGGAGWRCRARMLSTSRVHARGAHDVRAAGAAVERLGTGRLDRLQPVLLNRREYPDELPVAVVVAREPGPQAAEGVG